MAVRDLHSLLSELRETEFGVPSKDRRVGPAPDDVITHVNVTLGGVLQTLGVSVRHHYDHTENTGITRDKDLVGRPIALPLQVREGDIPVLTYTVPVKRLIYTTIHFCDFPGTLQPSYITTEGEEELADEVFFASNESRSLPFPLDKKEDEAKDGWALYYAEEIVMKIYFVV
jgi:hypothetical protein